MPVLFKSRPRLAESIAHTALANLPTPVEKLRGLSTHFGRNDLFIKRDDLSGGLYGGNKIRKLEFLLADAKKKRATRLITSGAAGSNHALATALYGKHLGFNVTLMLTEQPWNAAIGPTLLADAATGAEMILDPTYHSHRTHLKALTQEYTQKENMPPYVIPPGGSSLLGTIGYVNAAFELKEQITSGLLPEPAVIFVALGTMGTAAGLFLGLQAAGIRSTVCAVRVVPEVVADLHKCMTLFRECNNILRVSDPSFPHYQFDQSRFLFSDSWYGEGYGIPTIEAEHAITMFTEKDHITLDPVYTGKAAAAFLDYVQINPDAGPVLFINSKSSTFPETAQETSEYHLLPKPFHHYFTTP